MSGLWDGLVFNSAVLCFLLLSRISLPSPRGGRAAGLVLPPAAVKEVRRRCRAGHSPHVRHAPRTCSPRETLG